MRQKLILMCVVALVLCAAGAANAAVVNQATDLDLTNVVKTINFGGTTDQTVSGVTFLAADMGITVDGVTNNAVGTIANWAGGPTLSGPDAAALTEIYASNVYNSSAGWVVDFTVSLPSGYYKVQVLLYEQWTGSRNVILTAESTVADPLLMDTSTWPSGLVVDCNTPVTDGTLNISLSGDAANMHVAGLIISTATPPSDTTPPAAPTNLVATSNLDSISLDWDDNLEGDLDSYIVYRSTTSGSGYGVIDSVADSNYIDESPAINTPSYYVVAAKDTAGNVSAYSNEASATASGQGTLVDEVADLDLTNVLKAINFGNSPSETISGVTFSAASMGTTVDGVTNDSPGAAVIGEWGGATPVIGATANDDALENVLASSLYCYQGVDINIDVSGLLPGNYTVQILLFEAFAGQTRTGDFTIEGTLAADDYFQYAEQGGTNASGSVITTTLDVLDGNLDITGTANGSALHIAGLIVNTNALYEIGIIANPDLVRSAEKGARRRRS